MPGCADPGKPQELVSSKRRKERQATMTRRTHGLGSRWLAGKKQEVKEFANLGASSF